MWAPSPAKGDLSAITFALGLVLFVVTMTLTTVQQFHDEQGITLIADATKLAAQGKLKEGIGLPHPELYYGLERGLVRADRDRTGA